MALPEALLTPIPGDNPSGIDLRYDPVFDSIKEARREDLDVPQGDWAAPRKRADWPLVVRLAGDTLAHRSKDLQVAAWLVEAMLQRDGIAGLRQGLDLLLGLLERFWDTLFPELESGDSEMRAAPLEWIGQRLDLPVRLVPLDEDGHTYLDYRQSRLIPAEEEAEKDREKRTRREQALAEGKLLPEEFDRSFAATAPGWYAELVAELEEALARLRALDDLCEQRFGEESPNFRNLRSALEEVHHAASQLLRKKGSEGTPAGPDTAPPAPEDLAVESTAVVAPPPSAMVTTRDVEPPAKPATVPAAAPSALDLPRDREEAGALLAAVARFLRAESPTDPAAYLLLRGFRWGELRAHGSAVDPRLLVAPLTEVRTRLKTLLLAREWAALLEAAEEVMATPYGRGWLDLQRYSVTALEQLGGEHRHAAAAVRGALRQLLQDLPHLPEQSLMDDSPTANAETVRWLEETGIIPPAKPQPGEAVRLAPAAAWASAPDPFEMAMDHVRGGKPELAIELLMTEAARERSERGRFLRRSQAVGIMVDSGMETVATPILQEMLRLVDKHSLEEWEAGDVVAQALGMLFRCLEKREGRTSEVEGLYVRVCRLDPIQALRLTPEAGDGR